MERKIDNVLREWKNRDHKALIIRGPRQVGKTYSIRRFGSENYRSVVEINFEDSPDMRDLFSGDITADSLYENLGMVFPTETFDRDCLIFMDEIQSAPRALSALKPLVSDGRCDVVCSGSMLGNVLDTADGGDPPLTPLGYTETIGMEPMDFEEFLWAMGFNHGHTDVIRKHVREMKPMDGLVLNRITDLFKKYIVIGGMPDVVRTYRDTKDYGRCFTVLGEIYGKVSKDSMRYVSSNIDRTRVMRCLDSIPRQLSKEGNNSFSYHDIEGIRGRGEREYGNAISWLANAGIVDICRNLQEIKEPFRTKTDGNTFKIYIKDTGIMTYMLGAQSVAGIAGKSRDYNNGPVMENAVFETLVRKGYDVHYFRDSSGRMDIDFVVNLNGRLSAIEVKSGNKRRASSLRKAMEGNKTLTGMKIADSNISIDENGVLHYPLFGPCFFDDSQPPGIGSTDDLDEVMRRLDGRTD